MTVVGAAVVFAVGCLAPAPREQAESAQADHLVRALGEFPPALKATVRSNGTPDPVEARRAVAYQRLRDLGEGAMPALARGLTDPDVRVRRNVALFLAVAGGNWRTPGEPKLNIESCLNALTGALADSDPRVRQLSAQAVGTIGPAAAPAVPALIKLLEDEDEGSRNSACIGLADIGPAASAAMPALRKALNDPSNDVRRFAQRAIEKIEILR
jgi:HEAT repeat protein